MKCPTSRRLIHANTLGLRSQHNAVASFALVFGVAILPVALADTPIITGSGGAVQVVIDGAAVAVDNGLTVTGTDPVSGSLVIVDGLQSGDALAFDSGSLPGGVNGSWNGATGVLTFTGSAATADWQTLLRTVTFTTTSDTGAQRSITFSLGASLPFTDNDHFYEFVSAFGLSWTAARDAAAARSLFGLQGYLVTVTSDAENSFVSAKLSGEGWMGANDAAAESIWRWVTGPEGAEDSGNGRHFFTQTSAAANSPDLAGVYGGATSGGGVAVDGYYNNWNSGEPNDWAGEDYAHFRSDGTWNDYPHSTSIAGYVVEYGGSVGDPVLQITASQTINTAYALTYSSGAHGTLTGTTNQTVNMGDDGTAVTAVPDTGYHFTQWSDASTTNPRTDTAVSAHVAVTAGFAIDTFTLTYSAGANGALTGTTSQTVDYGTDGTAVTAVPAAGHHFAKWSDDVTDNPRTDTTVSANVNVIAIFAVNTAPSVTTGTVTYVHTTAATCDGLVTADGGDAVTARGVCWGTASNPTIADNKTSDGAGVGAFTSHLAELMPGTQYFVRAYATNAAGTMYGATRAFTTVPAHTPAPDLRVTLAATSAEANVNDDVAFRADVENVGDAAATAVVVRFPLPPNTEFVLARWATPESGRAATPTAYVEGDEIVVECGDVAPDEDITIELVLRAKTAGTIELTAAATSTEQTTPTTADANTAVAVDDEYWEVVNTVLPVNACGGLGLFPAFALLGLVGLRRHCAGGR